MIINFRYKFFSIILLIFGSANFSNGDEDELSQCLTYIDIEYNCDAYILDKIVAVDRTILKDDFFSRLSIVFFLVGDSLNPKNIESQHNLILDLKHWENNHLNGIISRAIGEIESYINISRIGSGIFCISARRYSNDLQVLEYVSFRVDVAQASIDLRVKSKKLRVMTEDVLVFEFNSLDCGLS